MPLAPIAGATEAKAGFDRLCRVPVDSGKRMGHKGKVSASGSSNEARDVEVALRLPLVSDGGDWMLDRAVMRRDAFPFADLCVRRLHEVEEILLRMDLHKCMLVDPAPPGLRVTKEQLRQVSEIISSAARRAFGG